MAVIIQQYCVDDLEDDREVPADQTIRFSVNGAAYEIDLAEKNAARFFDAIRPYQESGRRIKSPKRHRSAAERAQTARVRRWAKEKGRKIGDTGRIPGAIMTEYLEAQGQSAS